MTDPRSRIPSVDALLSSEAFAPLTERFPRPRIVQATRAVVSDVRARVAGAPDSAPDDIESPTAYARAVEARLAVADVPSLRGVINATGVVLHTNLGRAPLAVAAVRAMREVSGYSNLEYDVAEGVRGSRYVHCVSLLTELTGAEDALVVNNAAAGLVLALNTVGRGKKVAVSRGELVEIGGGFRIPEILERAGATLVEVGSTNRTRLEDYRVAIDGGAEALLKVHRSNFRISGFTEEVGVADLADLARARGVALVHDLGSGAMVDTTRLGLPAEPRAVESVLAGAGAVVVSGDKLLGGPQAGIVVGQGDLIAAMRKNPLCRALRVDKVTLAGLEATLRLYRDPERALDDVPTLRMLAAASSEVRARAEALAARLSAEGLECAVTESKGAVGGGTFPGVEIDSWALEVGANGRPDRLARALREGDPPVVARIVDDRLLLDVRTVLLGQEDALVRRVSEAVRGAEG
jgi:L-seryl-tRNA(Ser) seleniumtransferase